MTYNGIDLSPYLKIRSDFTLLLGKNIQSTMWQPTMGNGDKIALSRLANLTIPIPIVLETDATTTAQQKADYLKTVFREGTEYVPITFPELVSGRTFHGRAVGLSLDAYHFTVQEWTLNLTLLPVATGSTKTISGSGTSISGTISGTEPALGKITFTAGAVSELAVTLDGTTGNVTLAAPTGETLAGDWEIDLEKRTVRLDDALAMNYVDFWTTVFETFIPAAGAVSITFSESVTSPAFEYVEGFA